MKRPSYKTMYLDLLRRYDALRHVNADWKLLHDAAREEGHRVFSRLQATVRVDATAPRVLHVSQLEWYCISLAMDSMVRYPQSGEDLGDSIWPVALQVNGVPVVWGRE